MRRESNERKRGHGYIREQRNVREEKAYMTQLSFAAGIVVGGVGQGASGKRTRRCWTEGETERETERVVEKRWQKEETKGDRV